MGDLKAKDRVLLPLDGSEAGEAAIPNVVDVISRFNPNGIDVTLLSVVSEPEARRQQAIEYLEKVADRIRKRGITVNTMVTAGHPAEEIIRVSEKLGINLIAMSTHGRSGIRRWALGSITSKVIHHSDIPVVAVRAKSKFAA